MGSGGLGGSVCSVVGWGVLGGCGWLNGCWLSLHRESLGSLRGVQRAFKGLDFTRYADYLQERVSLGIV